MRLSGCGGSEQANSSVSKGSRAIEATNHTSWIINPFSVNDAKAVDVIGPWQGGGGALYTPPPSWTPDLTTKVDWKTDDVFASDVLEIAEPKRPDTTEMNKEARYQAWDAYSAEYHKWYEKIKAFNKNQSRRFPASGYAKQETCGITVHFLPCDDIKVTTSCYAYGHPAPPVKDPVRMEEPEVCPQ